MPISKPPQAKHSEQNVLNDSFDEDFGVLVSEPVTYNPVSGNLERVTGIQGNGSLVVSYNAAGDVVKLEKTIGGVTYTKTISNADTTVASTKEISAWS